MSFFRPRQLQAWEVYTSAMSEAGFGTALWNPTPPHGRPHVKIGDVGYIRRGCFVWLFNAVEELGDQQLGVDVPLDFEVLQHDEEHVLKGLPRIPGPLSFMSQDSSAAGISGGTGPSTPASFNAEFSFKSGTSNAAILMTKDKSYITDVRRIQRFRNYFKKHFSSWLSFANESGEGIKERDLVFVTGVDLTADFSMLAFRHASQETKVTFTAGTNPTSASASAWGQWSWECSFPVYTNWGPQCLDPESESSTVSTSSAAGGQVSDIPNPQKFTQCVFIRKFCKRSPFIFRGLKAGAGPHDFDSADRPGGDTEDISCDSNLANVAEEDDDDSSEEFLKQDLLDVIAQYIFGSSNATSAIVHDNDYINLRRVLGGENENRPLRDLLEQFRPQLVVDPDGVSEIVIPGGDQNAETDPVTSQ